MTKLCFLDTETTSLRHDRRAWEIGLIMRRVAAPDHETQLLVRSEDLDLGNADPMSLKIGRFYERHPQGRGDGQQSGARLVSEADAMAESEFLTRGAHLVGAVPNFDAEVLGNRMRANGICPSWHYHLIDIEPLAVGFLYGRRARQNEIVDGYPLENDGEQAPGLVRWDEPVRQAGLPWKSDDLTRALGVKPATEDERHTALGDARGAMRMYDAVVTR